MKINVNIEVDDSDGTICGEGCAFLNEDSCLLFNCSLEEDEVNPSRKRHYRCFYFDN